MSQPFVSVIIPNYNHEDFLKERLESVLNQIYQNFEVILLDDCSTDNSKELLLKYAENPKVSHCIFNEVNSGNPFIQWNKGIDLAKGEFIWIAESDDFCELNFLEELIQPMLQNSEVVLSYCQSSRVNKNGIVTGNWLDHTIDLDKQLFLTDFIVNGNEFIERFLIFKNVIPNASGVVFRKKEVIELGYLTIDADLKYCGDWLFYLQLIVNKKISYNAKLLNNFRYHSKSVIANAIKVESKIAIIDIELIMRLKMIDFLLIRKVHNFKAIKKINNKITKESKYEKALFLIRNNEKLKGFILLSTVLDEFLKNYQLKKNLRIKFLRFFKLSGNS